MTCACGHSRSCHEDADHVGTTICHRADCRCRGYHLPVGDDDAALEARDERCRTLILCAIKGRREQAQELRREAAELEKAAREYELAVEAGRWWELAGVLAAADINSLCQVAPTPPSDLLVA